MAHDIDQSVHDRELERQGKTFGNSGWRYLGIGIALAIPGVILLIVGDTGIGLALVLIAGIPGVIGVVLLVASAVARWSARHKPFA